MERQDVPGGAAHLVSDGSTSATLIMHHANRIHFTLKCILPTTPIIYAQAVVWNVVLKVMVRTPSVTGPWLRVKKNLTNVVCCTSRIVTFQNSTLSFWQRSDATLTVAKRALCSSCRPALSHMPTTCLKDPSAHPIRQISRELPPTLRPMSERGTQGSWKGRETHSATSGWP